MIYEEKYAGTGIHSCIALQALLRQERGRVDRNGKEFALVLFKLGGTPALEEKGGAFSRRISGAMRSVDTIGWFDAKNIGVLLPATGLEKARAFARRVAGKNGQQIPGSRISIFSYPAHWLSRITTDRSQPRAGEETTTEDFDRAICRGVPTWKRVTNLAGAVLALILAAPFFVIIPLYIKLVSPGRVFFLQKRVGLRGKVFTFFKFRTMSEANSESDHRAYLKELIATDKPMEKLDETRDRRIIPGGRFIRKSSLDELPQLINVLLGDMSLVGPRPCIPYEAAEYLRWHTQRFDVPPGMTGLWQVSGKNRLTFQEMIRLDISYSHRMSPTLDLFILLKTIPTVLSPVLAGVAKKMREVLGRRERGTTDRERKGFSAYGDEREKRNERSAENA